MKRVTRHPQGGWVALSRYGSTIATTSTRAAAWEAVRDAGPYVPRVPLPAELTAIERQARAAAEDLCDRCGGVGRCLVRGATSGHRNVRAVAIIPCPDCDGKGVKPTLDQQVREAAAKVWRKSNPNDPVPDWLLNGG